MSNKKTVGIDLGSTMSEVAVIENGEPVVVLTNEGTKTFPSVVSIDNKGERKVGASAKRQMLMHPKETINLIKRLMGRNWEEAQEAIPHLAYDVINKNGWPYVKIYDKEYSPQEISSWILGALKKMAEDYTGETITDAVITVPALFSDLARKATKQAGELAGLNVLRIINEPTAAAIASKLDKSGIYMVTDFGGSTLDNSVLDFDKSTNIVEILASNGDTWLGGADIDNATAKYVVDEYKKESGIDLSKDNMAMQRVMEAVEKAKIELSSSSQAEINLPYITVIDNVPQHLVTTLTKAKFEQIITPLVNRVIESAKKAVSLANDKSSFDKLDGVILVGGSCRIPLVQEKLKKAFNCELIKKADFDLAVAEGAAIQAKSIVNPEDTDVLLLDVTPISLGIEVNGNMFGKLIDANTTIPCKKSQVFTTAVDNQPAVSIVVLQGERPMSKDNKQIGLFNLDGIAPAPRGIPQIEVTFDIDANGTLTVSAKDLGTQKEQHITISDSNSLSQDEIDRIKKEAEDHKAEDEKKKAEMDKRNQAESYVYSVEHSLSDDNVKDKFTADEKKQLQDLVDEAKKAIESKNDDELYAKKDELEKVYAPIITRIYKENAPKDSNGNPQVDPNVFNQMFGGANGFAQGQQGFDPSQFEETKPKN